MSARAPAAPSPAQALALGMLQGVAELYPVSSSAHVALLPWLARWPWATAGGRERKDLAVALHAGSAAGLLAGAGAPMLAGAARRPRVILLAAVPAAIAGGLGRGVVERRLSTPAITAAGLAGGGLALAVADLRPGSPRPLTAAGGVDGAWLGLAQAAALLPGVSRQGATLAMARARGFSRPDAAVLAAEVGLPVIAGAALRTRTLPRGGGALGAVSALAVTGLGARLRGRHPGALWPWALYRGALAALVIRRLRDDGAR